MNRTKGLSSFFKKLINIITHKKTPLVMLLLGQAYTVYLWQMETYAAILYAVSAATFIVSVATAFAFDGASTQIAFAKKETRLQWVISVVASIILTALSVAVALVVIGDYLHAAFSIGIFVYSWFIAVVVNVEPKRRRRKVK